MSLPPNWLFLRPCTAGSDSHLRILLRSADDMPDLVFLLVGIEGDLIGAATADPLRVGHPDEHLRRLVTAKESHADSCASRLGIGE